MKISSKLNELKPLDLNCNVFDVYSYDGLSMQDLLCQFFTKINECIKVSNETIDLASWLVNEGLKIEVVEKLMLWLNDGTLENLINVNLFNTLHTKIENINTQLAHIETYNILKYINLVVNGDYSNAIQTCLNENSICFLPQGEYNVNSTILIKTGQMLYGAGQRKTIIKANHSNSIVNLDGTGIVINRLTLNRNSVITDKSNGIDIGSSFLGQSRIQDIEIINNRIGLHCGDNTNFYSNVISNIWVNRYTHSAIWLEPFGSTGCVFENIYTTNWDDYTNKTKIKANTGFFIKNFSECSINQLNIEHTILNNAITTNTCDSIDFGTVHIEGLESIDIYGGILNTILTNKVKIKTLTLAFSKCYNGIKHWNILLNNGKNTHIHLEKFIARDNNKNNADYTNLCLCLNNSNDDNISIEIDYINDKDKLFNEYKTSGYVSIDGGRKHQIKRIGNRVNYNNIGENIETYILSDLPSEGYWKKGDRIINNSPIVGGYEKYICVETGARSNIEFGAIVNTTAYQSAITLVSGSIKYNDIFNIDGVNYKATSNIYGNNLINVEPTPSKTLSNAVVYNSKCKFSKTGIIESV